MSAYVIVDLGFGDSGKGALTHFIARETGAHTVVRFNGGAQAGHNVVLDDGRHHTFSQFGAASFLPGVRTLLSRFTVVHPPALLAEAAKLATVGVGDALDRLDIDEDALVITPFHQAAGQIRALASGHGSCGIGVGEAVQDSLTCGDVFRMRDLFSPYALALLARIQERKREEAHAIARGRYSERMIEPLRVFSDLSVAAAWLEVASQTRDRITCDPIERVLARGATLFEGAQGVLLDEWRGFHPHTTWSTCTPENALALIGGRTDVRAIGVTRTYATRHGAGPFPTEDRELSLPEPHNANGPWQGAFRQGALDLVLLRYAIEVSGVDAIALTHLDALAALDPWRACFGYAGVEDTSLFDIEGGVAVRIRPSPPRDLDFQARVTRELFRARPVYRELDRARPIAAIEAALEREVHFASDGPRTRHMRALARRLHETGAPHIAADVAP